MRNIGYNVELWAVLYALGKATEYARGSPLPILSKRFMVIHRLIRGPKGIDKDPPPGASTFVHNVKVACATFHELYSVVVLVDWVAGHAGRISDGITYTSKLMCFRSSPLDVFSKAPLLLDPDEDGE